MYTDATGVPIRGSFSGSYEGCITVGSMWLKINNATKLRQLRPRLKNSASNNLQSYHPQIIASSSSIALVSTHAVCEMCRAYHPEDLEAIAGVSFD